MAHRPLPRRVLLAGLCVLAAAPPRGSHAQPALAPYRAVWLGRYDCAQGATGLELVLDLILDRPAPEVFGVFRFFPLPENMSVPPGCFRVRGSADAETGGVILSAGDWLLRPPGYQTVDLELRLVSGGAVLAGRVLHPACGAVRLERTDRPVDVLGACADGLPVA